MARIPERLHLGQIEIIRPENKDIFHRSILLLVYGFHITMDCKKGEAGQRRILSVF
jgi:hypothetical protein